MDFKKRVVSETGTLHFQDADGELMYSEGEDGKPDLTKPCTAELYGPGSKEFSRASSAQQQRLTQQVRSKGRFKLTPAEELEARVKFLADCTRSFNNIEYEGKEGRDLFEAVYSDPGLGFIAEQANRYLGDWGNFTKGSAKG